MKEIKVHKIEFDNIDLKMALDHYIMYKYQMRLETEKFLKFNYSNYLIH